MVNGERGNARHRTEYRPRLHEREGERGKGRVLRGQLGPVGPVAASSARGVHLAPHPCKAVHAQLGSARANVRDGRHGDAIVRRAGARLDEEGAGRGGSLTRTRAHRTCMHASRDGPRQDLRAARV